MTPQIPQVTSDDDDFAPLDVRIVEVGPAAEVLLANTDDGCDTVRGSDC
ncbi:FxLD family lanthipeptide [Actinoplanes sp. NPDC051859]